MWTEDWLIVHWFEFQNMHDVHQLLLFVSRQASVLFWCTEIFSTRYYYIIEIIRKTLNVYCQFSAPNPLAICTRGRRRRTNYIICLHAHFYSLHLFQASKFHFSIFTHFFSFIWKRSGFPSFFFIRYVNMLFNDGWWWREWLWAFEFRLHSSENMSSEWSKHTHTHSSTKAIHLQSVYKSRWRREALVLVL